MSYEQVRTENPGADRARAGPSPREASVEVRKPGGGLYDAADDDAGIGESPVRTTPTGVNMAVP